MRALLSVYDKSGLLELAGALRELCCEIISTGGTFAFLRDNGIPALAVEQVTGFPEILDGRVKTLHPRIHAGLLARRELESHVGELREHEIEPIDIVAVNLYPFERTISDPACSLEDALENIDIGGPAMIRAAAKNFKDVIVLTDPADYAAALRRLREGTDDETFRRELAARAFQHVSLYDALVAGYLRGAAQALPAELTVPARLGQALRYGENPHQRAAAYLLVTGSNPLGVLTAKQLQGKELSYNNLLDADAAIRTASRFPDPTAVIVKHTVPCGLASRQSAAGAFAAALECDPISAFGGIVAINRPVDGATAEALRAIFLEVVVAPAFTGDAMVILGARTGLRLLELPVTRWANERGTAIRSITGGLLIQDEDNAEEAVDGWQVVTERAPTAEQLAELSFAWEACRMVKSNAIVLVKDRMLVGLGAGQPNRLDSVRLAAERAGDRAVGSVLASDAFFPFADGVELAIAAGVTAMVQPGGSVRDTDTIDACNRASVPMVFTGVRHFLH